MRTNFPSFECDRGWPAQLDRLHAAKRTAAVTLIITVSGHNRLGCTIPQMGEVDHLPDVGKIVGPP